MGYGISAGVAGRAAVTAAVAIVVAGCRGGERGGSGDRDRARPAAEIHAEYRDLAGGDRLRRFADGVTVSGVVAGLEDHGDGRLVRLEPGGGGVVALRFGDDGGAGAVRDAGSRVTEAPPGGALAIGDRVVARCQIGALVDETLYLRSCVRRAPARPPD